MKLFFLLLIFVLGAHCDFLYNHPPVDTDNMISYINSVQNDWIAGKNSRFESADQNSVKKLLGAYLDTPEWLQLPQKYFAELGVEELPTDFDSRTAWPKCESIREVRDQSNCGSCWVFGAVTAMSDRICIASNQTRQDRLSAEDLLSCCGFRCGFGCNGGFPSGAWSYWVRSGLSTGDIYGDTKWCKPYSLKPCDHHVVGNFDPCEGDSSTPSCTSTCQAGYSVDYEKDKIYGASSYSIPSNEQAIMTEIMNHGPVEVSFTVYEDFLAYKSGVYSHVTGSSLGGHAVRMIGWGVENSVPYWLVVNSWNEDWGDQGTFKIKRGQCGIESGVVAGLPKL